MRGQPQPQPQPQRRSRIAPSALARGRWGFYSRVVVAVSLLASALTVVGVSPVHATSVPTAVSACVPTTQQLNAGFELAGVGRLGASYPHLPRMGVDSAMVPPVILRSIAWIESNWQQFNSESLPVLSPDYGYGVMQITSGMAGAAGPSGTLPLSTQSKVGGNYLFNIAYAARMLAQLFNEMPQINNGDPTQLENWYYAIWAYNGWGWANNPNNSQFSRAGTPMTEPGNFPYQERVYYLVQHPPVGATGRPLWTPMSVTLPQSSAITHTPGLLTVKLTHRELPHLYGATYDVPQTLTAITAQTSASVHVRVYNTSGVPWTSFGGQPAFGLLYHWVQKSSPTNPNYDPNLHGIDVLDGPSTPITSSVAVGASVLVAVNVTAPHKPGSYLLEWDMSGRGSGWFSYNSVLAGVQPVTVESASNPAPPYMAPTPAPILAGNHAWLVTTIADSTLPVLTPGATYGRTVLLFNPGGAAWGAGYGLENLNTGAIGALPLPVVKACRTLSLTIAGTAPTVAGKYTVPWRLAAANGQTFGPVFKFAYTVSRGK
jgi:hypothetical protein